MSFSQALQSIVLAARNHSVGEVHLTLEVPWSVFKAMSHEYFRHMVEGTGGPAVEGSRTTMTINTAGGSVTVVGRLVAEKKPEPTDWQRRHPNGAMCEHPYCRCKD